MKIKSIQLSSPWNIFWLLIVVSLMSLFLSFPHSKKSVEKTVDKKTVILGTLSPSKGTPESPIDPGQARMTSKIKDETVSKGSVVITTPAPANNDTNAHSSSGSTSQNSELQVSASATGVGSFSVSVSPGSNQCDVLSKAFSEGKINNLNMRFNNDIGSNAVYQINGLGKDNSVWWTYKVNGQSPNQGCSLIKVNNNDRVEWSYIGS